MGLDPNSYENINDDPVHAAIQSSNIDILRLMIKKGCPCKSLNNRSPLFESIINRNIEAVKFFVEIGEIVKAKDFYFACSHASHFDKLELLLDHISDEELYSQVDGSYAVHWICESGNLKIIEAALNRGINVNLLNKYGLTGLHNLNVHTSETDRIRIFELFVQHGFDINIKCVDQNGKEVNSLLGQIILDISLRPKEIEWLLKHGARTDVKIQNKNFTILEYVNRHRNRELKQIFHKYNT